MRTSKAPSCSPLVLTRASRITVKFDISFPSFDEDTEQGYPWGNEDEGEGEEGGMAQEEEELPTIDHKSGRVMQKPRQAGNPFLWLLGVKQAGFSPSGGAQQVTAKKKKEPKYKEPEPEEDEFPEQEEYDPELTGEEDWDDEEAGSNYAPINARITINKVRNPDKPLFLRLRNVF